MTTELTAPRLTPLLVLRDFNGVAKRNLIRMLRTPQLMVFTLIQPIMLLIVFRYIFAGAVTMPEDVYVNYVVPAIFIEAVLVGSMTSAIGIAEDLKSGMIDRWRSLPMARSAVLAGRSITDLVRNVIALAVMVLIGVAVGFRFHSDFGSSLIALLLILAFGYSFGWVMLTLGMATRDPATATSAATGPTFLLLFASNALVPVETLPGWLQGFAKHQPLSVTTSAVRALFEEGDVTKYVWQSLAWSAGITVVFVLTAVGMYKSAAAK